MGTLLSEKISQDNLAQNLYSGAIAIFGLRQAEMSDLEWTRFLYSVCMYTCMIVTPDATNNINNIKFYWNIFFFSSRLLVGHTIFCYRYENTCFDRFYCQPKYDHLQTHQTAMWDAVADSTPWSAMYWHCRDDSTLYLFHVWGFSSFDNATSFVRRASSAIANASVNDYRLQFDSLYY